MEYKVLARGDDALPCDDAAVLRDYFNAGTSLGQLAQLWAKSDLRFRNVHPYFPGRRLLYHHNAKSQEFVNRHDALRSRMPFNARACGLSALTLHAALAVRIMLRGISEEVQAQLHCVRHLSIMGPCASRKCAQAG